MGGEDKRCKFTDMAIAVKRVKQFKISIKKTPKLYCISIAKNTD